MYVSCFIKYALPTAYYVSQCTLTLAFSVPLLLTFALFYFKSPPTTLTLSAIDYIIAIYVWFTHLQALGDKAKDSLYKLVNEMYVIG